MIAFEAARPRYTLPFAGKDYELLGTFGLIEAVEYAMKTHVGLVASQIVNGLPSHELAKVVAAVLNACGHKTDAKIVGDLLWNEVGLTGEADVDLRLHLYAFLSICLAPPGQREQKAKHMGEMTGEPGHPVASPGPSTDKPASAS